MEQVYRVPADRGQKDNRPATKRQQTGDKKTADLRQFIEKASESSRGPSTTIEKASESSRRPSTTIEKAGDNNRQNRVKETQPRRRNSATVMAVATAALRDSEPGSSDG